MDKQREIHALRERLSALEPVGLLGPEERFTLGSERLDTALGGGLSRAALHEVISTGSADAAAAIGFVTGLSLRAGGPSRPMLWVRQTSGEIETGKLYPHGLFEMGLDPRSVIQVRLKDAASVLRAGLEGARCEALGCVVIEIRGNPKVLDLTATRRLSLGAEESGVPVFLLREKAEPGAAVTRWQVRALASRPLEANAPGHPAFDITLVRQRAGACGLNWKMEWNRDRQEFQEQALSRPVASLPFDRKDQAAGAAHWRKTG